MDVFVAGLPSDLTDLGFKELFIEYSSVVSARVIKDKETGKSRCFGFVKILNPIEANLAIDSINERKFFGRKLFAKESEPKVPTALSHASVCL
jgi:RNA recognition motif-containing protein